MMCLPRFGPHWKWRITRTPPQLHASGKHSKLPEPHHCRKRMPKCKAVGLPAGQPSVEAHASPAIAWAEHLPPKLTPEVVQHLVDKFQKNYPGELLGPDSMPSIRLLSVVYEMTKSKHFKWVPWQLRLTARQYQEAVEARSHTAARTETQLLAMHSSMIPPR